MKKYPGLCKVIANKLMDGITLKITIEMAINCMWVVPKSQKYFVAGSSCTEQIFNTKAQLVGQLLADTKQVQVPYC